MPRGSRGDKRGRLQWKKSAATRGRKGGMGKRKKFDTWKVVQQKLRRTRTAIIPPAAGEGEAAAAGE